MAATAIADQNLVTERFNILTPKQGYVRIPRNQGRIRRRIRRRHYQTRTPAPVMGAGSSVGSFPKLPGRHCVKNLTASGKP